MKENSIIRKLISILLILCLTVINLQVNKSSISAQELETQISYSISGSTKVGETYDILINVKNIEQLYGASVDFVYDKDYMESAIEKSYESLVNNFTWDITSEKVCKIADEIK